jgi:hypothetical protein
MSFYTKFADVESLLTATSTTVLGSTDALLVFSGTDLRMHQTTVASVYGGGASVATTNTTATAIGNTGLTLLKSTGGSSSSWTLSDPTAANQIKTIAFVSSTTSTNFNVTTVAASIASSAGFSGTLINFGSTQTGAMCNTGQSVTLASLTSTQWVVIATNRNATTVTSGLVIAAQDGPVFS